MSNELMTSIEYKGWLQQLSMAAQCIADVPIADLHNHITRAETLGPILEPTMYVRGGADNLRDAQELVEAASALAAFGHRLQQKKAEEVKQ